MKRPKILITDDVHPVLAEKFISAGYECVVEPEITQEQVLEVIHQYEGIIISSKLYIGKDVLERAERLKFIGRVGSGMEVIDIEFADLRGIRYFNSPEGNRDAVGEHAVGMLLCLLTHICRANLEVKQLQWRREPNRGVELKGKTVGIIGYGQMGSAFAEKLSGFGVRILAYDKYNKNFGNGNVEEVQLEALYRETDILSIHLPLKPETFHFINYSFLTNFSKTIYLINTSRGKNVDTEALYRSIAEGKVAGAALDVLEKEQFKALSEPEIQLINKLYETGKVLITPHIAGWTVESKFKLAGILVEKILNSGYTVNELS